MSTQQRRIPDGADLREITRILNRQLDVLFGNRGGRIELIGDDGNLKNINGGAAISSNNYAFNIKSAAGKHEKILHSSGTPTLWDVPDSGPVASTLAVTGAATVGGTLAVTGATTLGSTLAVTGATTLTGALVANGAVTLGDAAGDAVAILGTLTVTPLATFTGGLTSTGTGTFNGALVANGAVTLGDAAADVITVTGTASFARLATFTLGLTSTGNVILGATAANTLTINATTLFRSNAAATDMEITLGRTGIDAYIAVVGVAGHYISSAAQGDLIIRSAAKIILGTAAQTALTIDTGPKIGLFGATPVVQQTVAAASTDLATVITLANSLRTGLRALGVFA